MGIADCIGRVGALAVALGVGMAGAASPAAAAEPVEPAAATALILCGTTCPTPDQSWIEAVRTHFIAPTQPGRNLDYVAVTTPQEYWPVTGVFRVLGMAIGDPSFFGPGGAAWPDVPWWKLSGLFDLTINQSIRAGVADLEAAMAQHGDDHLVIYGYSQGAAVAVEVKRKLAERYPTAAGAPDIRFVLGGDTNLPNGGLNARFPGLYIPILDLSFNGAEPTDTPFPTDVITRQYDGAADFPLYPLNVIADLNAVLGFLYLHSRPFDVSLPANPQDSPAYQGTHGDTSYYFFETPDLPLFAPLRMLGVPEPLIDVVEPFFRAVVETGYDRSIPPWEPTPARLIPPLTAPDVSAPAIRRTVAEDPAAVAVSSRDEEQEPAPSSAPEVPEEDDPPTAAGPADDATTTPVGPVERQVRRPALGAPGRAAAAAPAVDSVNEATSAASVAQPSASDADSDRADGPSGGAAGGDSAGGDAKGGDAKGGESEGAGD